MSTATPAIRRKTCWPWSAGCSNEPRAWARRAGMGSKRTAGGKPWQNGGCRWNKGGVVEHVTRGGDLAVVVGVAGSGKSTTLEAARHAWEAEGFTVRGAALSGIAAENLEHSSGLGSRTFAAWVRSWSKGYDHLSSKDVFVIDEAGLVGTRQLCRVLEHVEQAGAKLVLVGDPEQLQSIEAGAPFRGIAAEVGVVELSEVLRQTIDWQEDDQKTETRSADRVHCA